MEKDIQVSSGITAAEVEFKVSVPDLWSPEEPNLYELRAELKTEQGEDAWSCHTGFRDVKIVGNHFELNGERLVLKGVGRHDMWKGQGFTLTRAQMAEDMHLIKALGANFVRLVHYPHHRYIVEMADELGLLVTEEPGYWNMDFRTMPRSTIELGYQIMERTIRRDWNSPAIFAWLLGNECILTADYLKEGREHCRKLDPIARPVSFANNMPKEEAKPIFDQAGMDFYDQHIYTFDIDQFRKEADYFGPSRPFTVTEWGAHQWGQSDVVMEQTVDLIMDLEAEGKIAGTAFWEWADMPQFGRVEIATLNGILLEGVVTQGREPRPEVYQALARLFSGYRQPAVVGCPPVILPLKWSPSEPGASFQPVELQALVESTAGVKAWADLESRLAAYWPKADMAEDQWKRTGSKFVLWSGSDLVIGGVPFHLPSVEGTVRPLMLTADAPVTIPIGSECGRLHILGQVTFGAGYPLLGKRGDTVATYRLRYADGREKSLSVRNGMEVAEANRIAAATRIEPIATDAQPALRYVKDIVREQYQVLLWSIPVDGGKLETLHCESKAVHHSWPSSR